MFTSTQEVADFISEQNIELVDVRFCDVPGVQQHFTIPVSEFLDAALSDGLMFDGSSVRGFTAIHESDMKLIPDIYLRLRGPVPRVARPWSSTSRSSTPSPTSPSRATRARWPPRPRHTCAPPASPTTCFIGAEAEFYLFDDVRYQVTPHNTFFSVDSPEAYWNTGRVEEGGNMGYKAAHQGRLLPRLPRRSSTADVRDRDESDLPRRGPDWTIERAHHEVGIGRPAGDQLPLCDAADRGRRHDEVQVRHQELRPGEFGHSATFMPKPLFGDNGSGMHTHISLWKNGEPLFYDERGYGSAV